MARLHCRSGPHLRNPVRPGWWFDRWSNECDLASSTNGCHIFGIARRWPWPSENFLNIISPRIVYPTHKLAYSPTLSHLERYVPSTLKVYGRRWICSPRDINSWMRRCLQFDWMSWVEWRLYWMPRIESYALYLQFDWISRVESAVYLIGLSAYSCMGFIFICIKCLEWRHLFFMGFNCLD